MSLKEKIQAWWLLRLGNPVVRIGEAGAFRWRFRRFTFEVKTVSGNFKAVWTANESPYAQLLVAQDEDVHAFCEVVYEISMLLTTEKRFAEDIVKAIERYSKRLEKKAAVEGKKEDELDEEAALAFEKEVQEHIELQKRQRKKAEKEIDRRFESTAQKLREDGKN